MLCYYPWHIIFADRLISTETWHCMLPLASIARRALAQATTQMGYFSAFSAIETRITLPNGRSLPLDDGDVQFRMPAEFERHDGCWVAWPRRPDVWRAGREPAKKAFTDVILAVSQFEPVTVIAHQEQVRRLARAHGLRCMRRHAGRANRSVPTPLCRSGARRGQHCQTMCAWWR